MIFRIIIITIILLLSAPPVFSQAKVGSIGGLFLELSPDVRANGMGHTGVALTDSRAGFFNPAATAMINSDKRFKLSLGYLDMPAEIDVSHLTLTAKILKPKNFSGRGFHLGVGFYTVNLNLGDLIETTYQQGTDAGTGRIFHVDEISYNFSLGAGFSTFIDLSAGVTFKYFKEEYADEEAEGTAVDFGFQFSKDLGPCFFKRYINDKSRWLLRPSLGLAFTNFGPDLEIAKNEYPLPKKWGPGLALEIAREKIYNTGSWRQFSIIAAVEIEDYLSSSDYRKSLTKAGIEAGLFDAVYLRVGNGGYQNVDFNWGFSFNSQGIAYLLGAANATTGSFGHFFREKIRIAFHYALDDMTDLPDNIHYGLTVSF